MGRPEKALDPDAGPVERLAHDLRALRRTAGSPSYRTMAAASGISTTTLSRAANGERLPTLDTVRGYVLACGGDPVEWEPRWKEAETAAAQDVRARREDAGPPYRGLARFEPDDRHLFFGRDQAAGRLERLVCDHRLAVLFGASGSGKSSLLRAGLIPRLRERIAGGASPAVLRILTPGPRPAPTWSHLLDPAQDGPESWVVVDQFEELFTLCRDREERARFIDLLLAAREQGSRLRVLISVRADFYPRCLEHRGLADALLGAALALGPMTADELREAVVRPAAATGFLVERELTARLVDEVLAEPGGLPMLSHALLETWQRRRSRTLTVAAYESAGGVRGAIAATAEKVYGQLDAEAQTDARRLLLRMVEPGRGTPDTRRPLTRAELSEWADSGVAAVVDRLARARLLTTDEEGVQLAHEALLTCWPRLAGWLEEDRERLRHHRRLTEAAHAWTEADRDVGALYRGTRLDRAEELFAQDSALTAAERQFLTAALQARDAERRTAIRAARRSRILLGSLSAVLVVALISGLVAWTQARANDRQSTDTAARRVADVADSLRTTDPHTAMLLGAAAWRISPLPESRRALLGALAQPELDAFTGPLPADRASGFLTDAGRTLLGADGRAWRTWDVATHRRTGSGPLPSGAETLAVGPDAKVLVLSTSQGVRLWDTRSGHWTGSSRPLAGDSTSIAFGVGGHSYVTSDWDSDRVQLRSVADGRLLFEARAPDETEAAPSPDDRQFAVCPAGKSPQVWDTGSRRALPGAWQTAKGLCDDDNSRIVFGHGAPAAAHRFAVVSATGVHVWDTRTGHQVAALDTPEAKVAVLSADGAFLATAATKELTVWRLAAPAAPVFRQPLEDQHSCDSLAWNPGHLVLRCLQDATVHSFDTATATTAAWRAQALDDVLLAPDGQTLATAERIGDHYRFELRDTRGGRPARTLPPVRIPVSEEPGRPVVAQYTQPLMTFSPDGGSFAFGVSAVQQETSTQQTTVWDVRHNHALATMDLAPAQPVKGPSSLALAPGGRTLYVARQTGGTTTEDEVWDTKSHRRSATMAALRSDRLAVRPDGRFLVGEDRVAGLPSGRARDLDLVRGGGIRALAFTADGSRLAVGDYTGRVALWDGDLRRRSGILRDVFPDSRTDTPEAVSALALSPDGRTLAVGGDAGTLQLWDTTTQQPLGVPLPTPGEALGSLAFSADSRTLYVSGAHVPLRRYDIDPARTIRRVCSRAGTSLTRAQWQTYAPDTAYRNVCGHRP
ncbi:hypothetical protein ABZT17_43495 [Streptomyces sp. NPDC005648]|uniref:nSTAND1 domain-containing NTPase n=1 Tax=Streptomyces sp. NPDC005648 TaxID=3157044 RepID=UPI0033A16DE6